MMIGCSNGSGAQYVNAAGRAVVKCAKVHATLAEISEYLKLAYDAYKSENYDSLIVEAKKLGIEVGGCLAKEFVASMQPSDPEDAARALVWVQNDRATRARMMMDTLSAHWGGVEWE
jgi:hypothetical protein